MMTILTRSSDLQTVSLDKKIASSGEGEVWETNFSGILAKIYHDPTPERIEKLKAMLANPPVDPMKGKNHISIAFPQDLLIDGGGNCIGFLMPAVRSSRELPSIYHPRLRRRNAPGFNWYYLHVTALNTAWIIQAIHEKGYVLGDIKPQNILVSDRALVAVIDTDSFQVRDSKTGKVYRCTVGSDGFTPVELLGKDFSTTDQSEIHDRFRLAVLIHYLLFGYHPFSGEWKGTGESPDQTELIRKGLWYGGKNSLIRPSQTTISLDVVHPEIKRLFLNCFNDGHASPHLRPTAKDWYNTLKVAVEDLTICGKVDSHHHSRSYGKCYWCERSVTLGVDIFPGGLVTAAKPTANGTSQVAADKGLESIFPGISGTATTQPTKQKQRLAAQRQATTAGKATTTPSTVIPTILPSTRTSQTPIQKSTQSSLPIINVFLSKRKIIFIGSFVSVLVVSILSALSPAKQQSLYIQPLTVSTPQPSVVQQEILTPNETETFNSPEESPNTPTYVFKPAPIDSPTPQSNQQFSLSDFPKSSCGDSLPSSSTVYPINIYPVFIPYTDENLNKVRFHFCQDSIKKRRKGSEELAVQVSSFIESEKAISFARFINSEFDGAVVGEPTVIETDPITAARLKQEERRIDKLANKVFYEKHPELIERTIQADETDLAQEWHQIRQCIAEKDNLTSVNECK